MKKYIYRVAIVLSLVTLASCSKDLEEININPTKPEVVPTYGLFNYANKNFLMSTRREFSSGRMVLPWVNYSAQRNYTEEDRYQFREGVNNSLYTDIWLTIKNYKGILDFIDNPKNAAVVPTYGNPENQKAAARIMIAYAQLHLVDIYGDVPYYSYGSDDADFQALTLGTENEILTPKFASQEKIYADILNELKEAAESIDVGSNVFNGGDFLFGSGEKLKKFANSLRLRVAVRVKEVPELTTIAQQSITEAIAGGVMESNADSVTLEFQNDKINPAPWYYGSFVNIRNDFSPANTFVDLLKGKTKGQDNGFGVDPRLYVMVAPTTNLVPVIENGATEMKEVVVGLRASTTAPNVEENKYVRRTPDFYIGMPFGIPSALTGVQRPGVSQYGFNVYKADYKVEFMEYSEVEFLLSEINGWDDTHYKKGIKASMEKWNIPLAEIEAYLTNVPSANEENVITQKYISLFMVPVEAWSDYRRTGFPRSILKPGETYDLSVPITNEQGVVTQTEYVFQPLVALTDLPGRINYPTDLSLVNKANKDAAAQRMGGDEMSTKLIWAK